MYLFSRLLYYLVILPLSLLPLRVLYLLSNLLSLVLHRVVRYRSEVVERNIANSFPEKSGAERRLLIRKFYVHFADLVVEGIKLFTISKRQLLKRCVMQNPEFPVQMLKTGKPVMMIMAHTGNWEWGATISPFLFPGFQVLSIVHPLRNRFINAVLARNRGRFGMQMADIRNVKEFLRTHREQFWVNALNDQSPSNPRACHWTYFLNQPTAVMRGAENHARRYGMAVVYLEVSKPQRGVYHGVLHLITADATGTAVGEVTEKFTRCMEASIRRHPEMWLWTHKRWKLKPPEDVRFYSEVAADIHP
jgi:KDO2-lipid IV(A) lauroyltransferase